MSIISGYNAKQFSEMKENEMSLLHHAAFDSNIEAVSMMTSLPYFKDIVNDDNNDVLFISS